MSKLPAQYTGIQNRYKEVIAALETLGQATKIGRTPGQEDIRTGPACRGRSGPVRGSVHSHARRALAAGATADEIRHAIVLLTSTIGFPTVSAALSWADDVLEKK